MQIALQPLECAASSRVRFIEHGERADLSKISVAGAVQVKALGIPIVAVDVTEDDLDRGVGIGTF